MAAAAPAEAIPEKAAAPAKKGKGGLIIAVVVILLAAGGAAGGGYYFATKKSAAAPATGDAAKTEAAAVSGPALYLTMQPAFIVNLADEQASRYLQVEMEAMSRDSKALDDLKNHMPHIRNSLLLLLGQRRATDLVARADKEKLQAEVLAEVRRIMEKETGKPGIDAVYFTSFVMQ